jgi:hypothetical protein
MIVGIGKLRQPIQLLTTFRSLVDSWIEIDQVHSGRAGRREIHNNVSLTIEPARISHVRVVVGHHVDVVVVGPPDAFEVDRDWCSHRTRCWRHADDARFDDEVRARKRLVSAPDRNGVKASEIVGNSQRDVDSPVCTNVQLRNLFLLRSKPTTRYPIARLRFPNE